MRADQRTLPPSSVGLKRFRRYLLETPPGPHFYASLLGLQAFDWPHLARAVNRGFSYEVFEQLRDSSGLSLDDLLTWLQLAPRTLARRKQQRRFSPEESDRLLRAARVLGRALELFDGDREASLEWLTTPQRALGGELPIDVARTDVGAREVENLVGRVEHGVYS